MIVQYRLMNILMLSFFNTLLKKRTCIYFLFIFFIHANLSANQGGRVYEFLNLSSSSRITALGGYGIPDINNDIDMALFYPSLINKEMHQDLSLNFVSIFDDINYGTAAYSHTFEKYGSFTGRIHYIDYGRFEERDETGKEHGTFRVAEYAGIIGWGRQLGDNFFIGSNFKIIASDFYQWNSFGLAVDVSGSYIDKDELLAASLVLRNIGRQITHYHSGNNEPLPFEIVFGASKELENAPFRLFTVLHNLQKYDLTYDYRVINESPPASNTQDEEDDISDIADRVMRHFIGGIEFLPTENLNFHVGYNYRRRQELKVDTRASTVGFSWGLTLKISDFKFGFARSKYHLSGSPNHVTVSFNIDNVFGPQRVEVNNSEL